MSDCKIYPADTVDIAGNEQPVVDNIRENMSDSTIYPNGTMDIAGNEKQTVGESMSDCKTYPADTVDIYGNVWPTVGENIRNGIFGENVKVGYLNIDSGNITSTNFIISNTSTCSFKINNIRVFSAFPENIKKGKLNISIENSNNFAIIRNLQELNTIVASIKIIYKELI